MRNRIKGREDAGGVDAFPTRVVQDVLAKEADPEGSEGMSYLGKNILEEGTESAKTLRWECARQI